MFPLILHIMVKYMVELVKLLHVLMDTIVRLYHSESQSPHISIINLSRIFFS